MSDLTKEEILADFRGAQCAGCGGAKKPRMSFCYPCFKSLAPFRKSALYRKFGSGYEKAFRDAVKVFRQRNHNQKKP